MILLIYCVVFIFPTRASDPCESYIKFPNYETRQFNFTYDGSYKPLSDNHLDDSRNDWYGLPGYALWTAPPGYRFCGTYYPIWLNDVLPETVGEEAEAEVEVCLQVPGDDCQHSWEISVQKCRGFHVFKLERSPQSNSAYCLGPVTSEYSVPSSSVDPSVVHGLTHYEFASHLYFECRFTKPAEDDLYYAVSYYVNDRRVHSFPDQEWSDTLFMDQRLTEDVLKNNSINSLGFRIYCEVTLRSNPDGLPTDPFTSDSRFMGIQVIQNSMTVVSGQSIEIGLLPTVEVACGTDVNDEDCSLDVTVTEVQPSDNDPCSPNAIPTSCGVQFQKLTWAEQKTMIIAGENVDSYTSRTVITQFKLTTPSLHFQMPFWQNYDIGTISISVVKNQTVADGKKCYAVVDPHMGTFDGRRYEHQCEGDYVLYRHTELPMEVQIRSRLCNNNIAYCVCAVAVRVSQTVFRVDYCNAPVSSSRYYFASCETDRSLLRVQYRGNKFKIFMPTGTMVEAFESYKNFLNVFIYPTSDDIEKTRGLCGILNGDSSDDFRQRGEESSETDGGQRCFRDFSQSWMVPDDENLFYDDVISSLDKWNSAELQYCTCEGPTDGSDISDELVCSAESSKTCIIDETFTSLTDIQECVVTKRRRKRQTNSFVCNGACSEKKRKKRAFSNGWTEASARHYCNDLFKNSTTFQLCEDLGVVGGGRESTVDICVLDIELTGTTNFSRAALEMYKDGCVRDVQLNSTFEHATQSDGTSYVSNILAVTCTNDCNFNGVCVDGQCVCNVNFEMPDCSVDVRSAPEAYGLEYSGHCSRNDDTCDKISMYLNYVSDSAGSVCKLEGFVINSEGQTVDLETKTVKPVVPFYSEAVCRLPSTPTLNQDDLAYGFLVSVANDGQTFSDKRTLVVYDDRCLQCGNGDIVTCSLKTPTCLEDGRCYFEGETKSTDSCQVCVIVDGQLAGTWRKVTDRSCVSLGLPAASTVSPWFIMVSLVSWYML